MPPGAIDKWGGLWITHPRREPYRLAARYGTPGGPPARGAERGVVAAGGRRVMASRGRRGEVVRRT